MNYLELNLNTWEKRTETHIKSQMYNIEGFIAGKCSLKEIELNLLKDVKEKSLLHLQCHIGTDTLSWARRGANVTGIDFSSKSIWNAKELAKRAQLKATFIQSEIYAYQTFTQPCHDIVFVSYGALCWLPDMNRWAEVVSSSLKKGGQLCLVEFHPAFDLFEGYSYFTPKKPNIIQEGTYTENCNGETTTTATWAHPIGEVVTALIKNGLSIDNLTEYPYSTCNCFENLEEREAGHFYYSKSENPIPMLYSIMATKT